ncbi:MAG: hypothetical protein U0W65_11750 [Bacteroidia bacterium]|nr:hypothetical protein [Bacteroidota bacterium]
MSQSAKVVVMERPFEVKPYSKKELYERIGISKYIFNRWVKAIEPQLGKPIGGVYSVRQVLLIVETFGMPCQIVNQAA